MLFFRERLASENLESNEISSDHRVVTQNKVAGVTAYLSPTRTRGVLRPLRNTASGKGYGDPGCLLLSEHASLAAQ